MGALDKGHGVMHIQGYVVNAGVSTAYETNIHVVANYVSGTKAIDTFVKINNGMMTSKSSVQIDLDVFYTANSVGVAASTATITPTWFNSQP